MENKYTQLTFVDWCMSMEGIRNGITHDIFVQWMDAMKRVPIVKKYYWLKEDFDE